MRYVAKIALSAVLWVAAALPATAQTETLDTPQRILVQEILAEIRRIDTLQADFVQVNPNGSRWTGTFYLDRPGHMRIEYDNEPYLYVADGSFLSYYDGELDQRSDIPLGQSLADFFVREQIGLDDDVTVVDAGHSGASVYATVVQTDDPGAGTLTLYLTDQPRALERWVVVDGQGQRTEVTLTSRQTNIPLSGDLWRAPRPERDYRND
ncbi:MAG: outer membrane lipoprotein carrier protein LolA [Rhodospirillaceae bacterium]|nr:outer membrane lipoprotein carrier protein LolA [Rhodospirillaceae bacterium]